MPPNPGHVPQTANAVSEAPGTLLPIPEGRYRIGGESKWSYPLDGEGPIHDVELTAFRMDRYAVTNQQFAMFVEATNWQTDAEKFGWSFVFGGLLPEDFPPTRAVQSAPWWRQVMAADWRHPEGPHSDISDRSEHPVIDVSWNDAKAYCQYSGTRLPTEAEWEVAARGGVEGHPFPWGEELQPQGRHLGTSFRESSWDEHS